MRKLALVFAAVFALAGCGEDVPAEISEQIAKVRNYAVQICGFLPTATSVHGMLVSQNPEITGLFALARAICDVAVSGETPPLGLLNMDPKECPKINGVCVEGSFIPGGGAGQEPSEDAPHDDQ